MFIRRLKVSINYCCIPVSLKSRSVWSPTLMVMFSAGRCCHGCTVVSRATQWKAVTTQRELRIEPPQLPNLWPGSQWGDESYRGSEIFTSSGEKEDHPGVFTGTGILASHYLAVISPNTALPTNWRQMKTRSQLDVISIFKWNNGSPKKIHSFIDW